MGRFGQTSQLIFLIYLPVLVISSTMARDETFNKVPNVVSASIKLILEADRQRCNIFLVHHDPDVQSSFNVFENMGIFHEIKQSSSPTYNVHLAQLKEKQKIKTQMSSVRKSSQCATIVTIFSSSEDYNKYLKLFIDHVASDFQGLTHRDEHHYIFFISEKIFEKVMLSSALQKVKYKIGIRLRNTSLPYMTSSVCFYCGAYGSAKLVDILSQKLFPDFSINGNNRNLRFSCPTLLHFIVEVENSEFGHWRIKRGVFKYVLEFVKDKFNFSFIVVIPVGGSSGTIQKDGTWNGVVGDLIKNKADFGIAAANPERYPLIDFCPPVVYSRAIFVTGFPQKNYSWMAIYWPFRSDLWIALIISWLFVLITFWILGKYENRITNTPENLFNKHKLEYMTFVLVSQSIQQPLCLATRFLCLIWLFSSLVLNTSYVSKLVGILAIPLYSKQPETFNQLVQVSEHDFKWGMDTSGGALYAFFKSSKNPELHAIFTGMEAPSEPLNCLTRSVKTYFACITWEMMINYAMYRNFSIRQHQKGPLRISKDSALFASAGISMHPRAVFGANWNKAMRILMDMGVYAKWEQMDLQKVKKDRSVWLKSQSQSENTGEAEENKIKNKSLILKLSNLKAAFYLLFLGLSFSFLHFIWEIMVNRGYCQFLNKLVFAF